MSHLKEAALWAQEYLRNNYTEGDNRTQSKNERKLIEEMLDGLRHYIENCDIKERLTNQKEVFLNSDYSR